MPGLSWTSCRREDRPVLYSAPFARASYVEHAPLSIRGTVTTRRSSAASPVWKRVGVNGRLEWMGYERMLMAENRWPHKCVRSWRVVLERRRPDRDDLKYEANAEDDLLEAAETRRLHMLRGMFMAQTAEVEELLAARGT
jgi:hypothetical protein